jgi:hypothetical protein
MGPGHAQQAAKQDQRRAVEPADGVNPGFLVVVTPNTPVRCRPGRE